jgi:sugar phosphate isomerase/epimerase
MNTDEDNKMKLSIQTHGATDIIGTDAGFAAIKAAGFDAMDYAFGTDILNEETFREEAAKIREISERVGLPIHQTHTPFPWKKVQCDDPEFFANVILPTMHRAIEFSALIGAKIAVVHPLHYNVYLGNEELMFNMNMDYYRSMIPVCEKFDIRVGVENMYWGDKRRPAYVFDTCGQSWEFIRYLDTLNSEYMVGCVDVGHVGLPLMAEEEPWDMIRALGHDRVHSLHVHDNSYRSDAHVLPYLGTIDWNEVAKALGEIDYDGDLTYEVGGFITSFMDEEFVPVALKYSADVGRHICDMIDRNRPAK